MARLGQQARNGHLATMNVAFDAGADPAAQYRMAAQSRSHMSRGAFPAAHGPIHRAPANDGPQYGAHTHG